MNESHISVVDEFDKNGINLNDENNNNLIIGTTIGNHNEEDDCDINDGDLITTHHIDELMVCDTPRDEEEDEDMDNPPLIGDFVDPIISQIDADCVDNYEIIDDIKMIPEDDGEDEDENENEIENEDEDLVEEEDVDGDEGEDMNQIVDLNDDEEDEEDEEEGEEEEEEEEGEGEEEEEEEDEENVDEEEDDLNEDENENENYDEPPCNDEKDDNDVNLDNLITATTTTTTLTSTLPPESNSKPDPILYESDIINTSAPSIQVIPPISLIPSTQATTNPISTTTTTTTATPTSATVNVENDSFQSNQPTFEQQFANIFDDEEMLEVDFSSEDESQLNVGYFCIFCPETFTDRDEARRHYQKHVNYYSMMCSLCGEGATDMQEFVRHHKESHPEAKKGRYKRREQPIIDKWINGFLYAQATITRALPPRDHCPVCEKIFIPSQIESARPRKSSLSRKIDHIHRHLCYLPYECVRCKEEGKEYSVAYFESKANNHIKLKHPEIDDTDSRWLIFQKTISIGKLDDFIASYLSKFGITMEYERRPTKKLIRDVNVLSSLSATATSTSTSTSASCLVNGGNGLNGIVNNNCLSLSTKESTASSSVGEPTTLISTLNSTTAIANTLSSSTTTNSTINSVKNTTNPTSNETSKDNKSNSSNSRGNNKSNNNGGSGSGGIIVLDDEEDLEDQSLAGNSSVASEEPLIVDASNSMIIAVSPSHAEYIESGRTSNKRRYSEEYYCLFCNAKFPCKLDAYPHFGEHLEYKPVLCLLCDNKFPDTDAFTVHHQEKHREATDLMYEIREDQNIERWVDEFLESQITPLSNRLTLNCSCATCCPVCERLLPRRSLVASASTPCSSHNDVSFAEHIHQHLAYNAYECTFCKKLGHSTRIPNLDSSALKHVRENHYVRDATLYQLSRAFPKTLTIAKIERFIAESVQKRRILEKKWRLFKIEQIKMERLKLNQQLNAARLYQQQHLLQYQPQSNEFGTLNRENSMRHGSFLASSLKNNVNHVRVEGGRVVNLPSPFSIKAIQQRSNLKSFLSPGNCNPSKNNHSANINTSNNKNHNNHHHQNYQHRHQHQNNNNNNSSSSVMNLSMKSQNLDKRNGNVIHHRNMNHIYHNHSNTSNNSNTSPSTSTSTSNNRCSNNNQQKISSSQGNSSINNTTNSLMMNMMMNLNNLSNLSSINANLMKINNNNNKTATTTTTTTISTTSTTYKNNNNNNTNNTIDLTNDSPAKDEGNLSSGISTGVRFFVKCLHCSIELPNRKQLKVHHRQAHPGLNMACFTTPRPIIASEVSP